MSSIMARFRQPKASDYVYEKLLRENIRMIKAVCLCACVFSLLILLAKLVYEGSSMGLYTVFLCVVCGINAVLAIIEYARLRRSDTPHTLSNLMRISYRLLLYSLTLTLFGIFAGILNCLGGGTSIMFLVVCMWVFCMLIMPPVILIPYVICAFSAFFIGSALFAPEGLGDFFSYLVVLFSLIVIGIMRYTTVRARYENEEREKHLAIAAENARLLESFVNAYDSCIYLDLTEGTHTSIKGAAFLGKVQPSIGDNEDVMREWLATLPEQSAHELTDFARLHTLGARMRDVDVVSAEYQGPRGRWEQASFIAAEREADGALRSVMWAEKDIEDQRQEQLQRQALSNAISRTYIALYYYDLVGWMGIEVGADEAIRSYMPARTDIDTAVAAFEKYELTPEVAEANRSFWNFHTFPERLADRDIVSHEVLTRMHGWVQLNVVAYKRDENGTVTEILWMTREIDEDKRRQLEQQEALRTANRAAMAANRAKTTFLSNMSHDIRTPMNAIVGFAGIAAEHPDDQERVKDCLNKILISSNHLQRLINDILDMSHIESGKMVLHEVKCSLSEIAHSVMPVIQPQVAAKHHEFYIDSLGVHDEYVYADTLKLNQILINLLGNAVKFTPAGGTVSLEIEERPSSRQGYATYCFAIKDTGVGMSEEFLARIFRPFERESSSTVTGIEGTGLGLSITKNIVDIMGGTIAVESELGRGSTFTVELELKLQDDFVPHWHISQLDGYRALVVDDDYNSCHSVTTMLIEIGLRPEWTCSAKEALLHVHSALQHKDPYKVFIIDWMMPEMNGLELVRRLRREIDPNIPIIILTAYDWSSIAEEAKEAGVTAFCTKPIFMSDLEQALLSSIGGTMPPASEEELDERIPGTRLLVVEDNELNREVAVAVLTEAGFTVETAGDGTDAVTKLEQSEPGYYDVVLMDIQMPIMNGYEATQAIRQSERDDLRKIPVIAMTANAFEEDKMRAAASGMNDHITKPLDIKVLISTIRTYLS